jgi:curved DNA-binding protein CbpA
MVSFMSFEDDYYKLLDVDRNADSFLIQSAYRKLAKKFHPDVSGGSSHQFIKLNLARQILLDPIKRREFDSAYDTLFKPEHKNTGLSAKDNDTYNAELNRNYINFQYHKFSKEEDNIWQYLYNNNSRIRLRADHLHALNNLPFIDFKRRILISKLNLNYFKYAHLLRFFTNDEIYEQCGQISADDVHISFLNSRYFFLSSRFGSHPELMNIGEYCLLEGHENASIDLMALTKTLDTNILEASVKKIVQNLDPPYDLKKYELDNIYYRRSQIHRSILNALEGNYVIQHGSSFYAMKEERCDVVRIKKFSNWIGAWHWSVTPTEYKF